MKEREGLKLLLQVFLVTWCELFRIIGQGIGLIYYSAEIGFKNARWTRRVTYDAVMKSSRKDGDR